MKCKACERPMRPLFTSYVCDYCDGLDNTEYYQGFIVYRDNDEFSHYSYLPKLVFRFRTSAATWLTINYLTDLSIRKVYCLYPFNWYRTNNIEQAADIYHLYPDHRHPPVPGRIFLAREGDGDVES